MNMKINKPDWKNIISSRPGSIFGPTEKEQKMSLVTEKKMVQGSRSNRYCF